MTPERVLLILLVATLVMSVLTYVAYWWDKRKSTRGGSRLSERTLHLLELFGGWPGAYLGARVFRHKTKKTWYRIVRGLCALTHIAVSCGILFWSVPS